MVVNGVCFMAKFCSNCGKEVNENAAICVNCGCSLENRNNGSSVNVTINNNNASGVSPKSRLVTFLLCTFLGGIGIHRFYVGKTGTGILWLFTLGCFGIGTFVDWIMILCGSFKDNNGLVISEWNN